nr:MAG TPA: hypothetical protein [Caudoviricetes sp.]
MLYQTFQMPLNIDCHLLHMFLIYLQKEFLILFDN